MVDTTPIENAYLHCPRCAANNPAPGTVPFKCPECGFASFFGPVAAVGGLIVNEAGKLLLVRRARNPGKGKWGLPGGFVDRTETVEAALRREVLEETGLSLTSTDYLISYPNQYNYQGVVAAVIDFFYVCRAESDSPLQLAEDELDAFEWVIPTANYLDNMAFESNRHAVELWHSQ